MATQEQLLTSITEISQADSIRVVTAAPDSSNILLSDLIARILQPYKITATVAANNLTVAIVHASDGAAISVTRPMIFKIGDTFRLCTAALTVTKNAGTNWLRAGASELAAQDVDYFVYVIYETGASVGVKLGFARFASANVMGDFVNTATDPKYIAGNWTNFNATDAVKVVGRFRARLSASAAFNWSIPTVLLVHVPTFETGWLSYVPTMTSSVGAITTVGTHVGTYKVMGELANISSRCIITTNGTGAGSIRITTPFDILSNQFIGVGSRISGPNILQGTPSVGNTYYAWFLQSGTYPGADGEDFRTHIPAMQI